VQNRPPIAPSLDLRSRSTLAHKSAIKVQKSCTKLCNVCKAKERKLLKTSSNDLNTQTTQLLLFFYDRAQNKQFIPFYENLSCIKASSADDTQSSEFCARNANCEFTACFCVEAKINAIFTFDIECDTSFECTCHTHHYARKLFL
jgi:hypothetical protein